MLLNLAALIFDCGGRASVEILPHAGLVMDAMERFRIVDGQRSQNEPGRRKRRGVRAILI
jgi:hypothetical protein